ncbi:PRC-barrel domain-containing protein [Nocardiopsis synnemataformans]|uniref:PRC-barrel domain-containing protein n=1 Tax=Nocardiopsis synnemataformans TaxID=61305 RepID=UPI003EBC5893
MSAFLFSELLGRRVTDSSGHTVGTVQDVVVRRDGEAYTVLGLVLGRGAFAGRLGYGGSLEPPSPWHRVLSWMRRHERYVAWEDVESLDGASVGIGVGYGDLPRHWREHEG